MVDGYASDSTNGSVCETQHAPHSPSHRRPAERSRRSTIPPVSASSDEMVTSPRCVRGIFPAVATTEHRPLRKESKYPTYDAHLSVPRQVCIRKRRSLDPVAGDVSVCLPFDPCCQLSVVKDPGGVGISDFDRTLLADAIMVPDRCPIRCTKSHRSIRLHAWLLSNDSSARKGFLRTLPCASQLLNASQLSGCTNFTGSSGLIGGSEGHFICST